MFSICGIRGQALRDKSFVSDWALAPPALMALAILLLGGCLQTSFQPPPSKDPPNAYDAIRSVDLQPRFPQSTRNADTGGVQPTGASYYGTSVEALVSPAAEHDGASPERDGAGGFSLNFENTPVATVAK